MRCGPGARGCLPGAAAWASFAGKPDPRADGPSRRAPGKGAPRPPASRGTPTALPALRASNNHRDRQPLGSSGGQLVARWPCAAKVQQGQRRLRVEGHRDGPFTPPGGGATLWPSWSPLVRSAGSAAARFGEYGTLWAIRKFPSIVHEYQSPIPRLARTAVGVPTNRPRSIDAAHDLEDDVSARLRGSGRDQTVTAARSRTDRQPGWLDGEPPLKPPANRSTLATTLGLPRTWRTPRPW